MNAHATQRKAQAISGKQRHILIMAGGTGGHIFPALAVADHMVQRGWQVSWLGTRAGMEGQAVANSGYPLEWVRFSGVRGKGLLRWATLPFFLVLACWQSARIVRRLNPDVVLGMGGFVALPGGLMTSLLNRPLVIHEQNSIAGLANRVLAAVADRVLAAFPGAFDVYPLRLYSFIPAPAAVQHVGNPVRAEIQALPAPAQRYAARAGVLRLLVVGGSLGAQALNATLPQALRVIPSERRPKVVHQAGERHLADLERAYREAGVEAELKAFIDDMARAYGECDLVVCRAGALTVAELCAAGVASVLVPFPHAVDDHQTSNARFLSEQGAGVLLPQSELTPQRLAAVIEGLVRRQLLEMAQHARALARPQATQEVARVCMELAHAA